MVGEPQTIEAYGCQCGETFPDLKSFRQHLFHTGRIEPGIHKSVGRVNPETGEIIMPPYLERTKEQQAASAIGKKKDGADKVGMIPASTYSEADWLKLVPRSYTIEFSPILRGGIVASQQLWGWRRDMPIGNFLDTVIHGFFADRGVRLAAYIIEETDEEREQRLAFLASQEKEEKPKEKPKEEREEKEQKPKEKGKKKQEVKV